MTNMYCLKICMRWHCIHVHILVLSTFLMKGYSKLVLNMILNQRSQDMLVANNWNVVQYAALLMMIAQSVNMIPGKMIHVIADAHIYDRIFQSSNILLSVQRIQLQLCIWTLVLNVFMTSHQSPLQFSTMFIVEKLKIYQLLFDQKKGEDFV